MKNIFLLPTGAVRLAKAMISVVIPTLNAAAHLPATFLSIFDAALDGLVTEVIVSDGGSTDNTRAVAESAGASFCTGTKGRGAQLKLGAELARKPWLLFLHADTALSKGWEDEVRAFIAKKEGRAAAFSFRLDDSGLLPRLLQASVALRCRLFALPYGDQGLLISRALYDAAGGFAPIPIMEDVEFVRRLGRKRIALLKTTAVTSADRFKREGYLRRSARNLWCLTLYFAGTPPERLVKTYG